MLFDQRKKSYVNFSLFTFTYYLIGKFRQKSEE